MSAFESLFFFNLTYHINDVFGACRSSPLKLKQPYCEAVSSRHADHFLCSFQTLQEPLLCNDVWSLVMTKLASRCAAYELDSQTPWPNIWIMKGLDALKLNSRTPKHGVRCAFPWFPFWHVAVKIWNFWWAPSPSWSYRAPAVIINGFHWGSNESLFQWSYFHPTQMLHV